MLESFFPYIYTHIHRICFLTIGCVLLKLRNEYACSVSFGLFSFDWGTHTHTHRYIQHHTRTHAHKNARAHTRTHTPRLAAPWRLNTGSGGGLR